MVSGKFAILALVFLVVSFSVLSMPSVVLAETTQAQAQSAIAAAQEQLIVCYQAVANASNAGANVTSLLLVLDQAGGNLSRADLAYDVGDNASAQSYAEQSLNLLVQSDVVARANALGNLAAVASFRGLMINIVGSFLGTVAVICGGFFVWTVLKKSYAKGEGVAR
jgi:hypothetical protein